MCWTSFGNFAPAERYPPTSFGEPRRFLKGARHEVAGIAKSSRDRSKQMTSSRMLEAVSKRTGATRKACQERPQEGNFEAELVRLDKEWLKERQQYLMYRRYGDPVEPSWFSMSIRLIAGLIALGFGISLVLPGTVEKAGIGIVLIFLGGFVPFYHWRNLSAFNSAFAEYQKRRM